MKTILILLAAIVLVGCTTATERKELATQHYSAQATFFEKQSAAVKPIFEMKGKEGETIELKGVQSLTVYGQQPQQSFQAAPAQQNEFAQVVDSLGNNIVKVGGVLAPVAMTKALIGGAVRMNEQTATAGTAGYAHIQAPGAVTTTTIGANSGAGSGTTSNANQANSTVGNNSGQGSGTNTIGANSGAGSGTSVVGANSGAGSGTSTVGANSGSNSGNSGWVAGGSNNDATATPTVVNQPAPVIVPTPQPVVVQPPAGQTCVVSASGVQCH